MSNKITQNFHKKIKEKQNKKDNQKSMNSYSFENNNLKIDYLKILNNRYKADVNLSDESISKLGGVLNYYYKNNKSMHFGYVIFYIIIFLIISISLFVLLNCNRFESSKIVDLLREYLYSSILSVIIIVVSALVFGITKIRFKRWK